MRRVWFAVWLSTLCAGAHAQSPAQRRAAVDRLLDALKAAPDERSASGLEERLEQAWLRAGSPVVTLLMSKGMRSLEAGQNDLAVEAFSDAITLQPDVSEAWHQRGLAHYHAGDLPSAIQDLQQAVQVEPRNFAAYRLLSEMAETRHDWKGAYAAWQKVMEVDPRTPGGGERSAVLKRKAGGEST